MGYTAYVVKQGDHLSRLAFTLNFDGTEVWEHEKNSELRNLRKNPNILLPGDVLFIPDGAPPPPLPLQGGQENNFVATIPEYETHLRLLDADVPIVNERYKITGIEPPLDGQTDGDGKLSFVVPVTTRSVTIVLEKHYEPIEVLLGDMDPTTEVVGVQKRLRGLGYYWGEFSGELDEATQYAIKKFQELKQLEVTGQLTDDVLAALEASFGS